MEQHDYDRNVDALVRSPCRGLAVRHPELDGVLLLPSPQDDKVVRDPGVLIQAHDGEERVEDLVHDLGPSLPLRATGDGVVEEAEHEETEHEEAGRDEDEPDQQSHVHGVFDPVLPVVDQELPVDFPDERHSEAPSSGRGRGCVSILDCRIGTGLLRGVAAAPAHDAGLEEPAFGRLGLEEEVEESLLAEVVIDQPPLDAGDVDGDEVPELRAPT